LDKPLVVQYEVYVSHLLHGDLGRSQLTRRPVATDLEQFVPASFELGVLALAMATMVGVPLGLVAALRRGSLLDHVMRLVFLGGISTPAFWVGLIALYVFSFVLQIAPFSGRLSPGFLPPPHTTGLYTIDSLLAGDIDTFGDAVHHLILPAAVLATSTVGVLQRFTRSAVLEIIHNDYITAAKAKGLPPSRILVRYTLRAALTPILTVFGLVFASLTTGAVLVESVFAYPGMGLYAAHSALSLDIGAITGVCIFVASVYVVTNFVVDVVYALIDPRVRLG
jgi:peptide/nickel transport system permease protein